MPLLEVKDLTKTFVARSLFGTRRVVTAANCVSFHLDRGEAVALVGESGSGKTTIARLIVRLETPDRGMILLDGKDVLSYEPRKASVNYRRKVQMIFQDPFGSLNPMQTVGYHIKRPLLRHRKADKSNVRQKILNLLSAVGLEPPEEFVDRIPEELSGGQRQRVAIARALAVEPELLIADEPTSMLDVSFRMGILNLLRNLIEGGNLAILLITHDLASARYLSKRMLVLFKGLIVEEGRSDEIVTSPAHPYTKALIASVACGPEEKAPVRSGLECEQVSDGCPFYSRCSESSNVCARVTPVPRITGDRVVRCHIYDSFPQGIPRQ